MRYLMKALQLMAFVSDWSSKALEDGQVTMDELYELGKGICKILDVDFKVDLL